MMFASNSSFCHLLLYLCITDIRIQLKTDEMKYITEILHQRQLNPAKPHCIGGKICFSFVDYTYDCRAL